MEWNIPNAILEETNHFFRSGSIWIQVTLELLSVNRYVWWYLAAKAIGSKLKLISAEKSYHLISLRSIKLNERLALVFVPERSSVGRRRCHLQQYKRNFDGRHKKKIREANRNKKEPKKKKKKKKKKRKKKRDKKKCRNCKAFNHEGESTVTWKRTRRKSIAKLTEIRTIPCYWRIVEATVATGRNGWTITVKAK